MPRTWLSVPIGRTGIRLGRSIADAELRPRLPNWRRYELRLAFMEFAKSKGEPITREDADYLIDKALATGAVDSNGDISLHVKGDREECVAQIVEASEGLGKPTDREKAGQLLDKATAPKPWPRWLIASMLGGAVWGAIAARLLGVI